MTYPAKHVRRGIPELPSNYEFILNFTAVSLLTVVSAISGVRGPVLPASAPATTNTANSAIVQTADASNSVQQNPNDTTEEYVQTYFADIPIMINIAQCESHFKQFDSDGSVHRGNVDPRDVGVMQINEHYQGSTASKEGYDIYTLEGNTAYARDLYERQGTKPWDSSKGCWGKYIGTDGAQVAMNSNS